MNSEGRNELAPVDPKTWTLSTGPHDMSGIFLLWFPSCSLAIFHEVLFEKLIGLRCAEENRGEAIMRVVSRSGFYPGPTW